MRRWRRRSDWTASRPVRSGLVVLGGISGILVLSTLYLFGLLYESRRTMQDSVREDAMWAVFQTDRQAAALRAVIDGVLLSGDPAGLTEVKTAYDLLYSRASILQEGNFVIKFDATEDLRTTAAQTSAGILDLADPVDALPADTPSLPRAQLVDLKQRLEEVQKSTDALVLVTDSALGAARVAARTKAQRLETALGANVAALVVGFAGIIVLLVVQMRQTARVGRKLALLSERNRAIASRAKAASRAKSTFLATMSHEIRTPLNGIIGASDLLARTVMTPEQGRFLSMVRQSGHHLLEVITDVLDFSKLESGKVEFEVHRVPLPEVADALGAMLTPRVDASRVALRIDLPAIEVGTDPARLRQLLVNLTGNAVKFTAQGSVSVQGWLCAPDRLRVEIKDTGIGIAEDAMPMLFREFSQIDGSASRSYGGTGLGLAICRRIVEGLGGRIGVESALGNGSTFWFELPVADPRPCEGGSPTDASPAIDSQATFNGRVLLVEDNPINCAVAEGLLGLLGLGVELARNGAEAVDILSREGFDLVLMDVQMPVMSGIEATREIRRRGQPVRIVGLTGNAFISDRADCLRAGMDDFLAKPVTLEKLAQALDRAGLRVEPGTRDLRHGSTDQDAIVQVEAASETIQQTVLASECEPMPSAKGTDQEIDAGLLATLVETLEFDTVIALLDDLGAEADAMPEAVMAAEAMGDPARADRALHSLKGAAATLGLVGAARRLQELRGQPVPAAVAEEVRGAIRSAIDSAKELVAPMGRSDAA